MSGWKAYDNWDRDLRGLTPEQLDERLRLASERERSSMRRGMGRNPKAARDWRAKRDAVLAEIERRGPRE